MRFKLYISICYHFNMFLGLRKCQHSGVATSSGPSPHQGCGLAFKGCRMQRRVRRNQGEALAEGDPQGMVTACNSFVIMFHPSNDHPTHSLTQWGSHECKPKPSCNIWTLHDTSTPAISTPATLTPATSTDNHIDTHSLHLPSCHPCWQPQQC